MKKKKNLVEEENLPQMAYEITMYCKECRYKASRGGYTELPIFSKQEIVVLLPHNPRCVIDCGCPNITLMEQNMEVTDTHTVVHYRLKRKG